MVCHANVRSVLAPGRLYELKLLVSMHNIDVLCLSETWLKPKDLNSAISLPGFQPPLRLDRSQRRGGGVAIYIKDGIAATRLATSVGNLECLAVKLHFPKRKSLLVLTAYRAPNEDNDVFLDNLEEFLTRLPVANLLLVGDFNAKHSFWLSSQDTNSEGRALKVFADSHNLHQLVTDPTYNVSSNNPSLLDLVFTNRPCSVLSTSTLPPMADHCPVVTSLSLTKSPPPKSYSRVQFVYADADVDGLLHYLSSVNWPDFDRLDVNDSTVCWSDIFLSACSRFIPKQQKRVNPSSKPWFSPYLRYLARYRDRLFKRSRGMPTSSKVMIAYRTVRNLFVAELRAAEKRYFASLGYRLTSCQLGPRKWWHLAKQACGWSTTRQIPALSVNNVLLTSSSDKADAFNAHFQQQCSASPPAISIPLTTPDSPLFHEFQQVSASDVATELRKLCLYKSSGVDDISNGLLKIGLQEISQHLASIFNHSMSEGVFPASWKSAILSPVLKSGKDASLPSSYRPIALLSCVSKVFERLVCKQITSFCFENNVLPDEQYGFLKGRSAEWQLLTVLQDWHHALDRKNCVHAIFLDAAKAFDRVDHSVLLRKLADSGVVGSALKWFGSYLTERRIQTRVDGTVSSALPVTSGVPQGSVLGPLLFLLYFKDIPTVVDAAAALFADDTMIYRCDCVGDASQPCCSIENDLVSLSNWAVSNKVEFNAAKSADICVGSKPSSSPAILDGQPLPRVACQKHLGVTLSCNLKWDEHISQLLSQVAGPVALCKRLAYRYHMPFSPVRRFYVAFIRPRLEYCSAVWGGCPRRWQRKLERQQLHVARAMLASHRLSQESSSSSLLCAAGLPTLAWRRRLHRLVLLWKLVHGCGPPRLQEHLPPSLSQRCAYNMRKAHSIEFPSSVRASSFFSFLSLAIADWNSLPASCVQSSSPSSFLSSISKFFSCDKFSFGL